MRCIRVIVCMINLWHPNGCNTVIIFCPFVDRLLVFLSWCALCMHLLRSCRTGSMGLPRSGHASLLSYDHGCTPAALVLCGLLHVMCGLFPLVILGFNIVLFLEQQK
uniref:Uncharacterized protein n=1 Tax=Opuntia streptacantha TaxID=393608 RepID=A0A7C9DPX9_OPUST